MTLLASVQRLLLIVLVVCLSACGSGSSSNSELQSAVSSLTILSSSSSSSSSSFSSSSSRSSSSVGNGKVKLSGTVTYDYVPVKTSGIGLDYSAIVKRPVRGAVIELVNDQNGVIASSTLDDSGNYIFNVTANTIAKLRVKAQLLHTSAPTWNVSVLDNTNNDFLYTMEGSSASVGTVASVRNLNAPSGWQGNNYGSARVSAPFAVLDAVYQGISRINAAGNNKNFPELQLLWSENNISADGDVSKGEIGTTYFDVDNNAIYVLGNADTDTDEFDTHVLLHEWGHYIEDNFFRSDSIGGDHSSGDYLDLRVSMSEGFADAFSGILLDDPKYTDASGVVQGSGFVMDVSKKTNAVKGYYSEASISSVFYNYYISSKNKPAKDLDTIYSVLSNTGYTHNPAMTSIFLFASQLNVGFSGYATTLNELLIEQNIHPSDAYGTGETNDAGLSVSLPIYSNIQTDAVPVNVCSASKFGTFNKLANSQFLKLNIAQSGSYSIKANSSVNGTKALPEFYIYNQGKPVAASANAGDDSVSESVNLTKGTYIIEIYDINNHNEQNAAQNTHCFNVSVSAN